MGVRILSPGLLSTIQDSGRFGYQSAGIAPSGPVDFRAACEANILVGNRRSLACIEMTLEGATMVFTEANVIALSGGDCRARLDGIAVPTCAALAVKKGQTLSVGRNITGCRSYLAVAGGFDVPETLGSRSTNLKCAIGGADGKILREGGELAFAAARPDLPRVNLRKTRAGDFGWPCTVIRVVPGPQAEYFTPRGIADFYAGSYTVTGRSDRMASVLDGPAVEAEGKTDIVSDGIPFGAIQIPSDGKPIVMLADRQTTGGYAKIATIASADLPLFAQRRPGERVIFRAVTVEEAVEARRLMMAELAELERRMKSYE